MKMNRLFQTKLFLPFEIVGFALIVISVLWLLFPQNRFEELLKKEKGNDLLIVQYLENISKKERLDRELYETLLEKYSSLGFVDKALRELSENGSLYFGQKELLQREYDLLKKKYFLSSKDSKKIVKNRVKKSLEELVQKEDRWENLLGYYKDAVSFSFFDVARSIVKRGIELDPSNIEWYKKGVYLSKAAGSFNDMEFYLSRLIKLDPANRISYLLQKWEMEADFGKYAQASETYLQLSKEEKERRVEWLEKSALYAKYAKKYKKSAKRYLEAMRYAGSYKEKKRVFLLAVEALRWGGYDKRAAMLVKRYMNYFIGDESVAKVMLQTALAAGDLKLAHKISLGLMERIK